ncbi:AEC family transporter [Azotosporobacter soli]|uniref:AEC family transporter n=1 Tax=Azotosporobacter soli TaxID=3055040 RepID=UPI0031FE588F
MVMEFFHSIQSMISIILMIIAGYQLTVKGWLDATIGRAFARLITNVALPCYMIWNLLSSFNKALLLELAKGMLVPFASIALSFVLAYATAKLIRVPRQRRGIFRSMFFVSNSIFIGLPVNLALFGEASVPYVLLYYIANTTFFWTVGVGGIQQDGSKTPGIDWRGVAGKVFSPPLLGFLLAMALILLGWQLPVFVMDTCHYLGNLTTPLSMLFIGLTIRSVDLKRLEFSRDMAAVLAGRFIVAPAVIFAVAQLLPLPLLMQKVFIIQAALPVMTQTAIVAQSYGADAKYGAVVTTLSTIVGMFVIPVYMALFAVAGW